VVVTTQLVPAHWAHADCDAASGARDVVANNKARPIEMD
jgi:hypothetical protein